MTQAFYNAHLVPIQVAVPGAGVASRSFIAAVAPALYAVAPVALAAAGYVAAEPTGQRADDPLRPGVSV